MEYIDLKPKDHQEVFQKGCLLAEKELERLLDKMQKKQEKTYENLSKQKQQLLDGYSSRFEIEEAYNFDLISKAEYEKRITLWDNTTMQPIPEDFVIQFLYRCLRDLQEYKVIELL